MNPDSNNLAAILAHRMQAGIPIPLPIALGIVRQVCDVLDMALRLVDPAGNPVIHRDVSPRHIFLAENGVVALAASATPQSTYAYVAPEYAMAGMLDARADLFALGVIAYEMLTNQPLFATGDDRQTLERVCTMPIAPPSAVNPHVPPVLDGIVLSALARDPARRWPYAAMFRDAIVGAAQQLGLALDPVPVSAWLVAPAAPQMSPPPAPVAPPPAAQAAPTPPAWEDADNEATRMEPVDPAMFETPPPAPPPPAPPPPAPPPQAAPPPPSPPQAAAPPPPPDPPRRPPSAFDPDIGPEPTQIGAMPLISLGKTGPLNALIGEWAPAPRSSQATVLPPPKVTYLADPAEQKRWQLERKHLVIGGVVLAVVVVVVIVLIVL